LAATTAVKPGPDKVKARKISDLEALRATTDKSLMVAACHARNRANGA